MMRILFVIGILCGFNHTLFAQYENARWLLGIHGIWPFPFGGSKIEFIGSSRIVTYEPRNIYLSGCYSGLSKKDDSWFVYSNGCAVANKNHDTLLNGDALGPGATQLLSGLNIPGQAILFPGDTATQKVYLFYTNTQNSMPGHPLGSNPSSKQLFYAVIDPLAAGGQGELLSKNNVVISDTLEIGNALAVRHANGRDWWVLVKRFYEDRYYATLVTPDSVYAPFSYTTQSSDAVIGGQACFSPDGNFYASFSNLSQLKIYNFNRCNGMLSNYLGKFITNQVAGSTSFSPNSRFLYISSIDSLWQFDMQAADVLASQTFIGKWDGFSDSITGQQTIFGPHWLAPDGKIYLVSLNQALSIHVINQPDLPGQACDFQQHSLNIPRINNNTIPTYINLALYHLPGSPCDTLGVGSKTLQISDTELKIFPNSCDGRFSIEFTPQRVSGMLYLYDVSGKTIYREYVAPFSSIKNMDLGEVLSNGIYAIRVVFGQYIFSGKVIVQRE